MLTMICDRCGKKVEPFDPKSLRYLGLHIEYTNRDEINLCESCFDDLMVWFYKIQDPGITTIYKAEQVKKARQI